MRIATSDERMACVTVLASLIEAHGSIGAVRCSSAQARGRAKDYAYWGAARYEVRLGVDGYPTCVAQERASSDRRSQGLAEQDADEIATAEGRYRTQTIGKIGEDEAAKILRWLAQSEEASR